MAHNLVKQALDAMPGKTPASVKTFMKSLFAKAPDDDLDMMTPEMLAETVGIHWDLSQKRKKNKPAIHIHTTFLDKDDPGTGLTIINLVSDDMAFLVDSVAAEITQSKRLINLLIHPVLYAKKDKITAKSSKDSLAQSHIHIRLQGAMAKTEITALEKRLCRVMRDVRYATRDWQKMKDRLLDCEKNLKNAPSKYSSAEISEYAQFLEYLYKDNFTLLGYREYKFVERKGKMQSQTVKGSSLGLLHDDVNPVYISEDKKGLPQKLQQLRYKLPPLTISKVNKRSTVHRPVPLDAIAVKKYNDKGHIVGEALFIGLFTSVTYSRSIQDIPLLRQKAEIITTKSGFKPGSHNYKALRHILEKYPRDEFFQIKNNELYKTSLSILRLQERQRIALFARKDPFRRYISCLVYVPRDRYDTRLRITIQKILEEEMQGTCDNFHTNLDDSMLARVIFNISTDQKNPPRYNTKKIEEKLEEAGRVWPERLAMALMESSIENQDIPEIVQQFGNAFPYGYRQTYTAKQAIYDIEKVEEVLEKDNLALDMYQCKRCEGHQMRLKIYQKDRPVILSDILPILENMGLKSLSELPFEITPLESKNAVWIHDFMMESKNTDETINIDDIKDKFEKALLKIWYGETDDDSLNHLVINADMDWYHVMVLRAYVHYMRQMRTSYSTRFIERTLYSNAALCHHIIRLFETCHDPKQQKKSKSSETKTLNAINKELEKVTSLEEDRILRTLVQLVKATLRTNFYQRDKDGDNKTYLAIKLDSRNIDELPHPRPYREIYIYSPRVEGVHLRYDAIARGGLRWSDRFEDFRTEILGLMKAQQVKNSLIVPMGAKGGFVVKKPPTEGGRDAQLKEGIECYKIFIRGLLDLTDNRKGKKIIPPKNLVRHDGDDPYLVVAADKGTATFSDIANGLSNEYGFWLGDAFASGGSAGYDHKAMGITARGAWESVKRHFRELNHDTQSQPFDAIGVGDMGGDVFGNGMILSDQIQLIGAFNHLHIFCDPNPDHEASFKERKRLFKKASGWDDYNQKLLSKGGKIYSRNDKSLKLTPEIKERFNIERETVTPIELIQAMLRARTDLLWFGGIGTYIKASHESHADVGDKNNDSLRISAKELNAKVIGEGANLAMTQAARIEFAEKGGRVNADFIDNSAGVDCSDHEVNIKILLTDVMSKKDHNITENKRNKLLEDMTDEVANLVLRNNYQQAQGISKMLMNAAENLPLHARLIDALERKYGLDRKLEGLPDREEIQLRTRNGKGLTRPELCVLQAHAKIITTNDLLDSSLPKEENIKAAWLFNYFPQPLRKKYTKEIQSHRLRTEIVATDIACHTVNRMGPTFIKSLIDRTGSSSTDIILAFLIVQEVFDLPKTWDAIEALDNKVPAQVQLTAMNEIAQMAERETFWFLSRLGRPINFSDDTKEFGSGVKELRKIMESVVTKEQKLHINQRTQTGVNDGLPKALARQIALIPTLSAACDIIRIAHDCNTDLPLTAQTYFDLGDHFHFDWLRQQAHFMDSNDRWTAEALDSLVEQLYGCQAGLTAHVLEVLKGTSKKDKTVKNWLQKCGHQATQFDPLFHDLRQQGNIDMPMLIIAEQRLRQLYGG